MKALSGLRLELPITLVEPEQVLLWYPGDASRTCNGTRPLGCHCDTPSPLTLWMIMEGTQHH